MTRLTSLGLVGALVVLAASTTQDTPTLHPRSSVEEITFLEETCESCSIVDDARMACDCRAKNASMAYATIDLSSCVGNCNGYLCWGGENFSQSCDDLQFQVAGPTFVRLRASCEGMNGKQQETQLTLGDRIMNDDGVLHCVN
ncbi:Cyanovirin-N [Dactylonectria estremocensis]|uniref:Cyanovirin-N n=1 Tax=Dactylonectria estremocensis TaxID=1079267 RepID=A0A9P9DB76_9HYPO|nr:Cyanovirin-N [Dactylonectria estremocensis]